MRSEEYCYVWGIWDTRLDCSAFRLTPLGQSIGDTESLLWPTPTDKGNYNKAGLSERSGDGLAIAAKLWPTPMERDWKSTSSNGNQENSRPLSEVAGLTGTGSLSPNFVEWLQGFPKDWTLISGELPKCRIHSQKANGTGRCG